MGLLAVCALRAETDEEPLALEQAAMEGWRKGDPGPMLATLDRDVTYYHVMPEKRLDGLEAVRAWIEPYRGRPLFDRYEISEAKTQRSGNLAVLTYTLATQQGEMSRRWHGTQVDQRTEQGWRVIHTHWSLVKS